MNPYLKNNPVAQNKGHVTERRGLSTGHSS